MKMVLLCAALVFTACSQPQVQDNTHAESCKIGAYSLDDISALQKSEYADIAPDKLNALALQFLPCVGSTDPKIRDEIVYASLSSLLRGERLEVATQNKLMAHLLTVLDGAPDADGFLKPFAALNISELARADRIAPYLSVDTRQHLVTSTASYLANITDYRGYDDSEGWRHGVAHSADIILQLSLNPNINTAQLTELRTALGTQIAPKSGHSYIYGEAERLARPVLYMAAQGQFTGENWQDWFAQIADPAPFASWGDMYTSENGLAKLHNTKAFLNVLYINATESKNENIKQILPAVRTALIALP